MKFFIDTTNNYLILYLEKNHKDIFFHKEKTNNNVVEIANKAIKDFLKQSSVTWSEIDQIYLNVGPGTFTGIKVGYNIIQTFNLLNNFKDIYIIDSLKLLGYNNKNPLLFISKTKVLYQEKKFFLTKKVKKDIKDIKNLDNFITYDNLTKEMIEDKIKNNVFKKVKDIESIVLKY